MSLERYRSNKDHEIAGAAIGAIAGGVAGSLVGFLYVLSQLTDADRQAIKGCNAPACDLQTSTDPAVMQARADLESHMTGFGLIIAAGAIGMGYLGYRIGK